MKTYSYVIILSMIFGIAYNSVSQEKNDELIIKSIENTIKKITNKNYDISIFNMDNPVINPTIYKERIKNPYGTLTGCYIFIAEGVTDSNLNIPKGFIGIYNYKKDSIVWYSIPLSKRISNLSGNISTIGEINSDGKTEIIFSQYLEPHGTIEQLWIFNWDGIKGSLITELDANNESIIICDPYYELVDVDGDGIYEIKGFWYKNENTDKKVRVTYSWNGAIYGNWDKNSKYFQKGKSK